ncbi:MAG: alpha/beta hydrolase [Sphingomonadales bacterium]|nr:alpha/beta hydrolase [Sphingomonadales bacterium]
MLAFTARNAARYPATVETIALGDCPLYKVTPETVRHPDCALLYIHGGGFFMGGGDGAKLAAMPFAARMGMAVYSLDYRMPPDHPFPAAIEDGVAAWRWLLARFPAERIAVYGPSAGGNLAPATILAIRAAGLPLPAVCGVHSPAADLTECGDSFATNTTLDTVLQRPMPELMNLYADGHDKRDPIASPAFADYAPGFPPTIITTGTRDLLLSSAVMLHRQMRRGGVDARLHVWDAMTHAPFFDSPEEDELMDETCRFLLAHLGK